MKKSLALFLIFFSVLSYIAQNKERVKDSIQTEIVNVVTTYNPKIANAKKINKNPTIKLLKRNEKKKLTYRVIPAPIASTFIPKSGVAKKLNNDVKTHVYNNYLAAGIGNYTSPYFETFLNHNGQFNNEFGLNSKYDASYGNIQNSILNSNFSTFNLGAFYKKKERYFDWNVHLNTEKKLYNWYGLPDMVFSKSTINAINEKQRYNYFELIGTFDVRDSYMNWGKIKTHYYIDDYKSAELYTKLNAKLKFPLTFLNPELNDISIKTSIEFLKGSFENSFENENSIEYATTTLSFNPKYKLNYENTTVKAGLKLFASLDSENNSKNIFIIPDFLIERPLFSNHLNIYLGLSGDLHTNTYKNFTEKNPYVSPTLFITQTLEKSNLYIGFNGKINNQLSYHIKTSYKSEEDKPLFLKNNSKSDGTNTALNGKTIKGYEYGNSFKVFYDDIKTTSIFTELAYNYSKEITFEAQGIYNMYTTHRSPEAWNLPSVKASFLAKYNNPKWYATSNIHYVSERKDLSYNSQFTGNFTNIETLKSFVDVNLNGGYHFNNKFSVFLKLNNILNTNYQRFANFNTQGFQVLGGMRYKFDF